LRKKILVEIIKIENKNRNLENFLKISKTRMGNARGKCTDFLVGCAESKCHPQFRTRCLTLEMFELIFFKSEVLVPNLE